MEQRRQAVLAAASSAAGVGTTAGTTRDLQPPRHPSLLLAAVRRDPHRPLPCLCRLLGRCRGRRDGLVDGRVVRGWAGLGGGRREGEGAGYQSQQGALADMASPPPPPPPPHTPHPTPPHPTPPPPPTTHHHHHHHHTTTHHHHHTPPHHPAAAMVGTWKKGPGVELFQALEDDLGSVPILAGRWTRSFAHHCAERPFAALAPCLSVSISPAEPPNIDCLQQRI